MRKVINELESNDLHADLRVLSVQQADSKERILTEADKLFSHYGIKSITMDELSRNLGISKKTFYQSFASKDELVKEWVQRNLERIDEEISASMLSALNAVEEVFIYIHKHKEQMLKLNPLIFHELVKYHPGSLALAKDHRCNEEKNWVVNLIKRGIREGLFRSDLDFEILGRYQIHMKDICMSPEVFPPSEFHVFRLMDEVMLNFLVGLTTVEGHRVVNEFMAAEVKTDKTKTA